MNIVLPELIEALKGAQTTPPDEEKTVSYAGPQQIVVLDRGWVFVGETTKHEDSIHIKNARCIRIWGTSRGLGELAEEGPKEGTKLDSCGEIIAPLKSLIFVLPCKRVW